MMETLTTHPSTAQQAKAFTSPASLSYPGGAADLTPPSSEADVHKQVNGQKNGFMNQQSQDSLASVTPATPAATPGAGPGVSGIVPTLQ
jgi:transcription initiation factor TFIID TATA-box-binding protein